MSTEPSNAASRPTRAQSAGAAAPSAPFGAPLILTAIVLTALNLRTAVTGFSPLLDTIGSDLGFGSELYGVFGTIVTASFALSSFVAARVGRRFGLEATVACAALLTSIGILGRAVSTGPTMLVLTSIIAFAGVGTSNVMIIPLVKRYFADRLKSVSTLYMALLQAGQFIAPLLAVPVALAAGWRVSVGIWAIPTLVAAALWFVSARRRARAAAGAGPATEISLPHSIRGAWRTPVLWGLVALFAMTSLNTYVIITWLPTILVDAGADPAASGSLLALFSVLGLGAAFLVPPATLGLRNPSVIVIACVVLMAVGYAGLLINPLGGAIAWVIALGLGVSTFPMALTLVNARTTTTAGAALLSSAMQGIGYGIACIGPLLVGVLHASSGDWTGTYLLLFSSLVVLLIGGLVASRPQALEEQVAQRD